MTEQCFVPPSPPSPPMPPTPPAPARAAIESSVTLLGYNASTFGEAQRSAFIAVVVTLLRVSQRTSCLSRARFYFRQRFLCGRPLVKLGFFHARCALSGKVLRLLLRCVYCCIRSFHAIETEILRGTSCSYSY